MHPRIHLSVNKEQLAATITPWHCIRFLFKKNKLSKHIVKAKTKPHFPSANKMQNKHNPTWQLKIFLKENCSVDTRSTLVFTTFRHILFEHIHITTHMTVCILARFPATRHYSRSEPKRTEPHTVCQHMTFEIKGLSVNEIFNNK